MADGTHVTRVLLLDAFAATPHAGNPAGVVLDAARLDDTAMPHVAREVGFSETAFVLPSAHADLRLRYFTPGHEVGRDGRVLVWAERDGATWQVRIARFRLACTSPAAVDCLESRTPGSTRGHATLAPPLRSLAKRRSRANVESARPRSTR